MHPIQGARASACSGVRSHARSSQRQMGSKVGPEVAFFVPSKVLALQATEAPQQLVLSHGADNCALLRIDALCVILQDCASTMAQYVFSMNRVGKIVPPKRQILKDISLSLLPRRQDRRARHQRLGQVHAAQDHGRRRQGDRRRSHPDAGPEDRLPAAGAAARPRPDRARSASRAAWARCSPPRQRLEEVYAAYGEEDADFDALAAEQAELEAIIAAAGTRLRAPARNRRRRAAPAAVGRQDRRALRR